MSTHVSTEVAAQQLNLSKQYIRTLCRAGDLNAEKVGNSWVINVESLERYGLKTAHRLAENHGTYFISKKKDIGFKPIALSFFSGAMGLDLGLEKAGFDIRLACEIDKFCRQTIALNRPDVALLDDINNYRADELLSVAGLSQSEPIDLVVGGPPCQAFSTAGKRRGLNDDRGNVFLKYIDLALELKPKFIVIENVRGLLSCPLKHRPHDKRGKGFPDLAEDELTGGALNFILNRLRASGYSYSFNLYNSANFGTPQTRERVIIVCSKDGRQVPFLTPTHSQDGSHSLKKWKTFQEVVQNIEEHSYVNFPDNRLKYYRLLKTGQNWRDLPENLQKEALGKSYYLGGGKTGFLRRLAWDKPSPTLLTRPNMPATDLAHPVEDRPLSIQEYKRVQEFPDDWEFAGSLIEQYKQIGNAVPISLGYAVGKLIRDLLNGVSIPSYTDFRYSRYKNTSHYDWEREFQDRLNLKKQKEAQLELNLS